MIWNSVSFCLQRPECWDYRRALPHLAYVVLRGEPIPNNWPYCIINVFIYACVIMSYCIDTHTCIRAYACVYLPKSFNPASRGLTEEFTIRRHGEILTLLFNSCFTFCSSNPFSKWGIRQTLTESSLFPSLTLTFSNNQEVGGCPSRALKQCLSRF